MVKIPKQPIYLTEIRDKEIWKPLVYPGVKNLYEISNYGRIRNRDGKMLSIYYDRDGYTRYTLQMENGKKKHFFGHRITAMHYLDNPENKPEINHKRVVYYIDIENGKCFNRCCNDDNYYGNLEWCTRSENIQHSIDNHLQEFVRGESHGYSIFSEKEVHEICDLLSKGYKNSEIYAIVCKDDKTQIQYSGLIRNLILSANGLRNPIWTDVTKHYKIPTASERRQMIFNR